jgi:hypothetical protein
MASSSVTSATSTTPNPPKQNGQSDAEFKDPELKDLETSLLALEKLDRASPDLWPDQIPGVSQFIPLETPNNSPQVNVLQGLTQDDLATIHQLGNLPVFSLLEEVKRLQNIAYQLGLEERKEMTRGKYLNILRKPRNYDF